MATPWMQFPQNAPLPQGWEARYDPQQARYYFINHHTHETTWRDPRVAAFAQQQNASPWQRQEEIPLRDLSAHGRSSETSSTPQPQETAFGVHRPTTPEDEDEDEEWKNALLQSAMESNKTLLFHEKVNMKEKFKREFKDLDEFEVENTLDTYNYDEEMSRAMLQSLQDALEEKKRKKAKEEEEKRKQKERELKRKAAERRKEMERIAKERQAEEEAERKRSSGPGSSTSVKTTSSVSKPGGVSWDYTPSVSSKIRTVTQQTRSDKSPKISSAPPKKQTKTTNNQPYTSSNRITPSGPQLSLRKGPDPSLLRPKSLQVMGPNKALVSGPQRNSVKGPGVTQPRALLNQGPQSSLRQGAQHSLLAKGSMFGPNQPTFVSAV